VKLGIGTFERAITLLKVEFVEDATSDYNFSPSLGEKGRLKVMVSPTPPAGGLADLGFRLYVVRETREGTDQFLEFVDVADPGYRIRREPLDIGTMTFEWDGIPHLGHGGSNQPEALGTHSFSGLSTTESANRVLPSVTVGRPVPPPICTAVATVYLRSTGLAVCSARKHILIPQVVLLVYEPGAVSLLQSRLTATDGTLLYDTITDVQWTNMRSQIRTQLETFYEGAKANIRVVDDPDHLALPYTTVRLVNGGDYYGRTWGWGGGCDFHSLRPNADLAEDMARVFVWNCRKIIQSTYASGTALPPLPLAPRNLAWSLAVTACHELGHSLGLVYNNTILGGLPYPACHDTGSVPAGCFWHLHYSGMPVETHLEPTADLQWRDLHAEYLKFILPKE
jgi:hypothetical protein